MLEFLLLSLATWRLTYFILHEDGPWNVAARVRERAGVNRPGEVTGWAVLFSCFYCMSFWTAAILWLLFIHDWHHGLLTILAASAVALAFNKAHDRI